MKERIGLAADHGGKELKSMIADFLKLMDVEVIDYGVSASTEKAVDYPDYAAFLAADVSSGKVSRGVAICGTGIGMSITANKFPGVRAALIWDEYTARMSRKHNDANILCLGARVLNPIRAVELVKIWLTCEFDGGRHADRLQKISEIERRVCVLPKAKPRDVT